MNDFRRTIRTLAIATLAVILTLLVTDRDTAALQDTTSKTVTPSGEATVNTAVKSGEVVYVSGNDLVVKLENGEVKHFTVPADFKFQVDGKDMTVSELKPGMRLTQTITSTATPHLVRSVRTIQGTVWHVSPPNLVVLQLPDNSKKKYDVPKGQTFEVNGQTVDAFHLKKGMAVTATVITESTETVHTTAQNVTGETPAPVETPPETGALLIAEPTAEKQETAAVSKPKLPNTASDLPLIVILGSISIAGWVAFRFSRHSRRSS